MMNWNIPKKKTRRATAKASMINGFKMNSLILLRSVLIVIRGYGEVVELKCRNLRNDDSVTLVDLESVTNKADEAPHRDHNEETDEAPDHELFAFLSLILIGSIEDKFNETPEEGEESDSHDDRQREVNESADGAHQSFQVAQLLSEDQGRCKGQSDKNNFFHLINLLNL